MTERLWAPWRLEYVSGAAESDGCIFCDKPGQDDDAALIVHRGTRAYVVLNLYPYTNGHLMVAPYRHLAAPDELDAEERAEFWQLMADGIAALTASMGPAGFNCGLNLGRAAGAGVEGHLHVHVVPRWNGDTNFMPVLADVRVMPEHLSRTLERVREAWPH
jgi:ATP adenylyltransferase